MTSSLPSLQNAVRKLDELAARCPDLAALQEVPLAELAVALDGLQATVAEARQALEDVQASVAAGEPDPGPEASWAGLRIWLRERIDQPMRRRIQQVASLLERIVPTLRNAGLRERAAQDLARFSFALDGPGDGLAAALAAAEPYEDMQRLSSMQPEDPGYDDLAEKCFFAWKPGRYALLLEALTASADEPEPVVAVAMPEPEPVVAEASPEPSPESEPAPEPEPEPVPIEAAVAESSPEPESEPPPIEAAAAPVAGPDAEAVSEDASEPAVEPVDAPVSERPWPELEEKPAAPPPIMDPAARTAPEDPFTRIMVSIPDKRYFTGKPAAREPKGEPPADRTLQDFLNWDGN